MPRKQWGTTYDEDTLKTFQGTCDQYGLKANTVLEALMRFFSDGQCKVVIDQNGTHIELK